MSFTAAERIADAVLYEGYLLYPYRASSAKNQVRWQFGVVAPREAAEGSGSENWEMLTDVLVRPTGGGGMADLHAAQVDVRVRYLHLQARTLEAPTADGAHHPVDRLELASGSVLPWDEAVEEALDAEGLTIGSLLREPLVFPLRADGDRTVEEARSEDGSVCGRIVRTRWPITGQVIVSAHAAGPFVRLRVHIENTSALLPGHTGRDGLLRVALLGAHTLLAVRGAEFVSLLDPPPDAREAVEGCDNQHTWPVLVGEPDERGLMLSSPIILYDYPQIAPESQGDLYDSTEIDEILTLRILTMTEDEKREARATDPRAQRILDRSEQIPPEVFERLHGAIRSVTPAVSMATPFDPAAPDPFDPDPFASQMEGAPFWEPEARVAPDMATVQVEGVLIGRGSRVRLRPAPHRDTMDMFLAGRVANVSGIFESVDDETFVAVTVEDDPAADMHEWYGRYFYFRPEEVEPLPHEVGAPI